MAKYTANKFKYGDNTYCIDGVPFVKGTQTAATGSWTGVLNDIGGSGASALYDGLTIAYWLPYNGSGNATLNLTINGTATGAKNCYYGGAARLTTHYGAGNIIYLTYQSAANVAGTNYAGWWAQANYDTNTVHEYAGSCVAGTNGMARYSLTMQVSQNRWQSVVTTSSIGTSKTKNSSGFLLDSPILYQNGNTYTSGQTAGQSACYAIHEGFDARYSHNAGENYATAGDPFYLVGTVNADGKFYLKNTTWWSKTLPSSADGYVYIYIGQFYSVNSITLHPYHPKFMYYEGKVRTYEETQLLKLSKPQLISVEPILDQSCIGLRVKILVPELFSSFYSGGSEYLQAVLGNNLESMNFYNVSISSRFRQFNCIFSNSFGDPTALYTNISLTFHSGDFTMLLGSTFKIGDFLLDIFNNGKGTLEQKKKALAIYNYCYYVNAIFGKFNSNYTTIPVLPSDFTSNRRILPDDEDNVYLKLLLPYNTTFSMGTSGFSSITSTLQIDRSGDFIYQIIFKATTAALLNSISLSWTPNGGMQSTTGSGSNYQRIVKFGYRWDELNSTKSIVVTTSSGSTTILVQPLRNIKGIIEGSNANQQGLGRAITQLFLNYCYGAYEQYWKARVETLLN